MQDPGITDGAVVGEQSTDAATDGRSDSGWWTGQRKALAAAALVAVAIGTLWLALSTVAHRNVTVQLSSPQCTGTKVVQQSVDIGLVRPMLAMRMRRGMRCVLPVQVTNNGSASVTVERVTFPLMGPGAGVSARVPEFYNAPTVTTPLDDTDAVFAVDRKIEGGRTWRFEAVFVFRESGCDSANSFTWSEEMPTLAIDAFGRTADKTAPGPLIGFAGTKQSSCDQTR